MSADRLVVVVTRATVVKLEDREVYAARFRKLGLTAYGDSYNDALNKLKHMFNRFVHLHRNAGLLVERLNRAGVEWSWADEYPGGPDSYENTNHPPADNSPPDSEVNGSQSAIDTLLSAAA